MHFLINRTFEIGRGKWGQEVAWIGTALNDNQRTEGSLTFHPPSLTAPAKSSQEASSKPSSIRLLRYVSFRIVPLSEVHFLFSILIDRLFAVQF